MEERHPDTEGSCEYIEYVVAGQPIKGDPPAWGLGV
jgi:hypothetical protein